MTRYNTIVMTVYCSIEIISSYLTTALSWSSNEIGKQVHWLDGTTLANSFIDSKFFIMLLCVLLKIN